VQFPAYWILSVHFHKKTTLLGKKIEEATEILKPTEVLLPIMLYTIIHFSPTQIRETISLS
jgi:hypothetical protein